MEAFMKNAILLLVIFFLPTLIFADSLCKVTVCKINLAEKKFECEIVNSNGLLYKAENFEKAEYCENFAKTAKEDIFSKLKNDQYIEWYFAEDKGFLFGTKVTRGYFFKADNLKELIE